MIMPANSVSRRLFLFLAISACFLVGAGSRELAAQDLRGRFIWSVADSKVDVAPGIVYFRKTFDATGIKSGLLEITCDDGYRVYLNGRLIGSNTVWGEVIRYDISELLVEGKNVLAVHAENASKSAAGLYCKATVNTSNATITIPSDKSWKFSSTAGTNWKLASFDDNGWKPALEQGIFGRTQPWGNNFKFRNEGAQSVTRRQSKLQRAGFEFVDGDRIVFLGGTFFERLQTNNYLESLITSQFSHLNLTFRNLGWSGDNVFGLSRAVFGSQADGFRRLENDLILADPTLVIVNYGLNESFHGPEYLPTFLEGLENLTTLIESTQADIVFLSPMLLENLGPPLPDPKPANENIRIYTKAIRDFAKANGHGFVVNLKPLGDDTISKTDTPAIRDQLTDNGMHLTAYGHWRVAPHLVRKFGGNPKSCLFDFDLKDKTFSAEHSTVNNVEFGKEQLAFTAKDDRLVSSPPPQHTPRGGKLAATHDTIRITGLPPGKYGLQIDGKPSILASEKQWATGVLIDRSKFMPQPDQLRTLIAKKNEMFFHRHRPQNETYLFLFRKHEQGNNAIEIPQFDPIISELEKQISVLKKPRVSNYRLTRLETDSPK